MRNFASVLIGWSGISSGLNACKPRVFVGFLGCKLGWQDVANKLNPYIRIIEAAKRGVGVKLTADEVYWMACDDAISQVAAQTAEGEECEGGAHKVTREGFVPL